MSRESWDSHAFGNPLQSRSCVPSVVHGKLHVGKDCWFGRSVVIDVDEECVIGDRCVIPDDCVLSGRRVEIGDDFYGYSWHNRQLDIGRGRRGEERAVFKAGKRNTAHDNRIDLAREVTLGDDVGLSPEVVIYTHHYWLSCLEGYPELYAPVTIGNGVIVGFRATILAGVGIAECAVIGAGAVVASTLAVPRTVYAGNPTRPLGPVLRTETPQRREALVHLLGEYRQTRAYRKLTEHDYVIDYPVVRFKGASLDVEARALLGEEDADVDDLRDFLFKRGVRVYTLRPFRRIVP